MRNSLQRKRTSSSTLTKANMLPHMAQINTRPVCLSQMSSVFTSVPPLFGTAQAFLLRLAQIEAQLVLNLISNVVAINKSGYGNPLVALNLLQPVGIQRSPFLSMYQRPCLKNMDSISHMVSHPSTTVTEINSVTANKESGALLTKETIQEKALGPFMNNTALPLPTSEEALVRSNHLGKHFSLKPHVECSQYRSMTAKSMTPPDRPQIEEAEPKQQTMLHFPTENLIKALSSLGLSLEDLEVLSHCPDNELTTEKLPFIIQDIQQRKGTKDIKYGHAQWNSSDQVESSRESSYANGEQRNQRIINGDWQESHSHRSLSPGRCRTSEVIYEHFSTQSRTLKRIRHSSGRRSDSILKRLQHGPAKVTRWRPGSDFPPHSKCSIRHSFASVDCNKMRNYTTQSPLSSSHRSTTYNAMTNGHHRFSFPIKSTKSEVTTESINNQMPVPKTTAKTSAQTGVIRVSGISIDYSESELIKMASPFGHCVEVLMAAEVDTATCLEWNKALLMFPTEFSAQEMVKVYSAIPVHMRQQSLELVSQTVDFSSPVSVFHAFVGPSLSNGLLTPSDHLLVVYNVPNQPSAATGVLRLLKPFGQVFRALLLHGNKVDVEQRLGNNSSIQMVLEMESASVALSVYEWSQKIPCVYHNHHLVFIRGCNIQKNTCKVNSA
ncbi:uncharacterized protein si:ch211-89o9.4 isoform X2 [Labeo rohita]|uniref:uncharacterized protein si:ch211-89o9.4 isoform X2 n=1 Tax=Labeo rohita TaxID=84645 RepID=UPI0021E286A0|nr:uncharacterized protein si:ch211-89o9.4 isoform X2 [Labeo rohita]